MIYVRTQSMIQTSEKHNRDGFHFPLIACLFAWAYYAWAAAKSHSMNADGISYLDMGDAYLGWNWEMATG